MNNDLPVFDINNLSSEFEIAHSSGKETAKESTIKFLTMLDELLNPTTKPPSERELDLARDCVTKLKEYLEFAEVTFND